jgi:glutamate-5-semialdehyde dehydrogenase
MENTILPLLKATKKASTSLQLISNQQRNQILLDIAKLLEDNVENIISENLKDLVKMDDNNPKKDRLLLNRDRIIAISNATKEVIDLAEPTNRILSNYTTPNNLNISKISVPIGVVGVIYESRPNVTIDVAILCIKSGNAVVLRGGSDAENTNKALVDIIHQALILNNINTDVVLLLPTERRHVTTLLEAEKYVDVIIPRGSQELIDFVRNNSRIPTIETGAGVCHTYVHVDADLNKAAAIVINAKTQRPSVCNALDTILVDSFIADKFLPKLFDEFLKFKVEIFADEIAYKIFVKLKYPFIHKAIPENFGIEYLSQKCSIKTIENIDEALEHIANYSSKHSEAIVSENKDICKRFLLEVDAAAVYSNASTRFTDGGVFGLGAEVGISTQKLHARGPFALDKLTTEKWVVEGNGQTR